MRSLHPPLKDFIFASLLWLILSPLLFYPALAGFGEVLLGFEDIQFFMWLFWHYEKSIETGADPLFASEIFHPYGISLARSTLSPLQGALYVLMPSGWGAFGKITALQLISFLLGGIFSFVLCYRFSGSFFPSLSGSVIFNLSALHAEKALHHLNYSMAFPFAALFFIIYYDFLEDRRRGLLPLSLSILLLAVNEITIAIMAGFVVFIDIVLRYQRTYGSGPLTPRTVMILSAGVIISLFSYELMAALGLHAIILYAIPPLFFISSCIIALGPERLIRAETESRYVRDLLIAGIPSCLLVALLALQPSYESYTPGIIVNVVSYSVPIEYFFIPSDLQFISSLGGGLEVLSETGIYFGITSILLLSASFLYGKASEDEKGSRNMALIFVLFSFPLINLGEMAIPTAFIPQPLFPLLPVLRVASRFLLFAHLFTAVAAALFLKRLLENARWRKLAPLLGFAIVALLLTERWPDLWSFQFNPTVPEFYLGMREGPASIFLFPNMDYFVAENEIYYQTIHGKNLSAGIVSMPPSGGNPVYSLYSNPPLHAVGDVLDIGSGYDFIVVQKLECSDHCFYPEPVYREQESLGEIKNAMEGRFGKPVYEDWRMLVYVTPG